MAYVGDSNERGVAVVNIVRVTIIIIKSFWDIPGQKLFPGNW